MPAIHALSTKGYFVYFDYCIVLIAIVCNCVVLSAVIKGRFNMSGYRRFLISLAASDLYVCTVNVTTMIYQIYITAQPSSSTMTLCGAKVLRTLQLAGFFASLLNIVGMSIDHFIGIVYPMNYRSFMNKHVARFAVAAVWAVSFSLAFLDIPINIALYRQIQNSHSSHHYASQPGGNYLPNFGASYFTASSNNSGNDDANSTRFLSFDRRPKRNSAANSAMTINSNKIITGGKTSLFPFHLSSDRTTDNADDDDDESDKQSAIFDALLKNLRKNYDDKLVLRNNRSGESGNKTATFSIDQILLVLRDDEKQLQEQQGADICTFFSISKMWFEMCVIGLALLCFVCLTICYGVILKKVSQRIDAGKKTTRKLILTTVILLSAFMICWLPFMVFEVSMLLFFQQGPSDATESKEAEALLAKSFFLHNFFNSILMCYPLIDPIIYAARIPAVQQSILVHCATCFPCCSQCIFVHCLSNANRRSLSSKLPRLAKLALTLPAANDLNHHQQHDTKLLSRAHSSAVNNNNNNRDSAYVRRKMYAQRRGIVSLTSEYAQEAAHGENGGNNDNKKPDDTTVKVGDVTVKGDDDDAIGEVSSKHNAMTKEL